MTEHNEISVKEAYSDYTPVIDVANVVRRLLRRVPEKYTRGLDCVVLTNFSGQSRRNRIGKLKSRGRRVSKSRVRGLYHSQWKGSPPWVTLYVDRICQNVPKWALWMPRLRDLIVAEVLYHELGHHVHFFIRPEYREKEDVADTWRGKFVGNFLRLEYWYLIPVFKLWKLFRQSTGPK
jgi:hypothetical protein